MRTGFVRDNNNRWLTTKSDFLGVNLGADYCAEHEWGISGIRRTLGVTPVDNKDFEPYGIDRRVIRKHEGVKWIEGKSSKGVKWEGFYLVNRYSTQTDDDVRRLINPNFYDKSKVYSAWDDTSFAIVSCDERCIGKLKKIFQAFQNDDICIFLGGGGIFENSGLVIAIKSKLPNYVTKKWYDYDKERHDLEKETEKSGICELLKKAGKDWYALFPSREKDGSLRWWLNPTDQKNNNFGWYNIDQLRQWASNTGPIPKR